VPAIHFSYSLSAGVPAKLKEGPFVTARLAVPAHMRTSARRHAEGRTLGPALGVSLRPLALEPEDQLADLLDSAGRAERVVLEARERATGGTARVGTGRAAGLGC
jgi:hypothetical protein